jgi:hypothetical protein
VYEEGAIAARELIIKLLGQREKEKERIPAPGLEPGLFG